MSASKETILGMLRGNSASPPALEQLNKELRFFGEFSVRDSRDTDAVIKHADDGLRQRRAPA